MDANFIRLRLDVIDAANECILERQSILSAMVAFSAIHNPLAHDRIKEELNEMDKSLKRYIAALERIQKEYENGSNN